MAGNYALSALSVPYGRRVPGSATSTRTSQEVELRTSQLGLRFPSDSD